MLIVAIFLAFIIIYLLNSQRTPPDPRESRVTNRRVAGVFTYNDMFDLSQDELPTNTVTGPGGGTLVKKFV